MKRRTSTPVRQGTSPEDRQQGGNGPNVKKKRRPHANPSSSLKRRAHALSTATSSGGVLTDSSTRGTKFPSADQRQRALDRFRKQKEDREHELERRRQFEEDEGLEMPDIGIVDTLVISLMGRLVDLDRRALPSKGFLPAKTEMIGIRKQNDQVGDLEPGPERWLRKSDGCRLFVRHDRCAVEFSAARGHGVSNNRLHELSEADLTAVVRAMTIELLPWSTLLASLRRPVDGMPRRDLCWGIKSLDTAKDFPGDTRQFVNAYDGVKWGRVRTPPMTFPKGNKDPTGLAWGKRINRMSVYDKGQEMRENEIPGGPPPGTVVRTERQHRGPAALSRLGKFLSAGRSHGRFRLPILETPKTNDGTGTRVVKRPFTNRDLHQSHADELNRLDGAALIRDSWAKELAAAMLKDGDLWRAFKRTRTTKTIRKYEKLMAAIQLSSLKAVNLLHGCYGRRKSEPSSSSSPPDATRRLR